MPASRWTASRWAARSGGPCWDTGGLQPWWQSVTDFAAAGAALDQTVYDRNGDYEFKQWDPAHGDALQADTVAHANGTSTQWSYDTAGANAWYQNMTDLMPGGVPADQTIYNRDGSTEVRSWDTAHGDALQA